jgi:hypothetical protein
MDVLVLVVRVDVAAWFEQRFYQQICTVEKQQNNTNH